VRVYVILLTIPSCRPQLSEQALALPYPAGQSHPLRNPSCQSLAVPQISTQSHVAGHAAKSAIDLSELFLIQASGTARSFPFLQSSQALHLKTPYPMLDRSRGISQQSRHSGQVMPWTPRSTPAVTPMRQGQKIVV
jgi:hypothetical protein